MNTKKASSRRRLKKLQSKTISMHANDAGVETQGRQF